MNIPPKYEDLVFQLNELNKREAALREEIEMAKQVQETTDAIVAMMDGQRDRWIEKCGILKQRLTVAEQRAEDLKKLLCDVINDAATGFAALKVDLANRVNDALNPADHPQCEECKGWGYHENHHEGGGTECGECSGSGKAPVEQFSGDTVVCRRYRLEQHPGQNFYHYDLEPVYGSVPMTVSDLITMAESAPVAVVLPDRLKTEPFTTIDRGSKNYKAGYNAALAEVARLNEVKP